MKKLYALQNHQWQSIRYYNLFCLFIVVAIFGAYYLDLMPANRAEDAGEFLVIIYVITAIGTHFTTRRLEQSQTLAVDRAHKIFNLEQALFLIMEKLPAGVLVIDKSGELQYSNNSAQLFFNEAPDLLNTIHTLLQLNPNVSHSIKSQYQEPRINIEIESLKNEFQDEHVIFLMNAEQIYQEAQALKLASLGRLTASIAHEVRNPLAAIAHATQLLQETPDLPDFQLHMLNIIHDQTKRIDHIVKSIVDLSRNQKNVGQLLDLRPWLEEFQSQYSYSTADYHINMECAHDAKIIFDPQQLYQILTNLCDNGLYYGQQISAKPTVTIRATTEKNTKTVQMMIEDEGPGVAPYQEALLFEPFFTTKSTGTGLGLYISKALCEANGARIVYKRDTGKGYFQLQIPLIE